MNPQIRRLMLDLGPLFLFFLSFQFAGIFKATAIFMVAVLAALAVGWHLEKRLSPIPLITAVLVVVFGGLTLYLHNETFIKVKVTVLYSIFGITLLTGLRFNRLFIKYVFTEAFDLTE
ncbi:MAG TPA: septation protein IspZ, partial [Rhizomicrobium sp.]|nr:septation protein IspZ [Rhizomicrobium sp.]